MPRRLSILLAALLACADLLLALPAPAQAVSNRISFQPLALPAPTPSQSSTRSTRSIGRSSTNSDGLLPTTATTTTTLQATPSPSVLTETVSLKATVTSALDATTPTGIVSLYGDGALLGIGAIATDNWIRLELPSLTTGTHVFTATYSGDSSFSPSTAPPLTHIVRRSGVRLGLYSENAFQVTFSFAVLPEVGSPAPDGSVIVSDGTSACTAAASAGRCTIAFPNAGPRWLTATYTGSAILESNVSAPFDYTVQRYPVTIQTAVTPPSVDAGQPITVSFVIMPSIVSPRWPSGLVTVRVGEGEPVCSKPQTTGSCTFVPTGRFALRLDYSGDDFFAPSSVSLGIRVRVGTAIHIDATPNPVRAGQALTLSAVLFSDGTACDVTYSCAPTGQVYYYDNGTYLATAGVHPRVGAVFPITVAVQGIGTHTITGTYSGDLFYSSSTSAPLMLQVVPQVSYVPLVVNQ